MFTVKSSVKIRETYGYDAVLLKEDFEGNQTVVAFFVHVEVAEQTAAILNQHAAVSVMEIIP